MKPFLRSCLIIGLAALTPWRAASAEPAAAPAGDKHGYTVMVDVKVNEKGETENVRLVETNDRSVGDVLSKMALAMALKTTLPVREKEGKPVKYTARMPFFFPIEADEGPASDQLPKPKVKEAKMPTYPTALRDSGQVGGAVLELLVDAEGKLTEVTTLRASHPEFEAAARESVSTWTFTAAQQDGKPVASRSRLAIAFETEQDMADLRWRVAPRPALGSFVVIRPDEPIPDEAVTPETPATAPTPAPASNQPAK